MCPCNDNFMQSFYPSPRVSSFTQRLSVIHLAFWSRTPPCSRDRPWVKNPVRPPWACAPGTELSSRKTAVLLAQRVLGEAWSPWRESNSRLAV